MSTFFCSAKVVKKWHKVKFLTDFFGDLDKIIYFCHRLLTI